MKEECESFNVDKVRGAALRTGMIAGILVWLVAGGWFGVSCHGCVDDNALGAGMAFAVFGAVSGFLAGTLAFTLYAVAACRPHARNWERYFDGVCWGDEGVSGAVIFISGIAILLLVGMAATAAFSLL